MAAIAVPIKQGKVDDWKRFARELKNERAGDFEEFNARMGLTSHRAYLQPTPQGEYLAVVVHEGAGADEFLSKLAKSDHPFDVWMREQISNAHGMDFTKPPPLPELWIDGSNGTGGKKR